MRNKRWTRTEDAVLRSLYPEGGWAACRACLPGRTVGSASARLELLGVKRKLPAVKFQSVTKPPPERVYEVKTRRCLKCRGDFKSSWPGERICPSCKNGFSWRNGMSDLVTTGRTVRPSGPGADR